MSKNKIKFIRSFKDKKGRNALGLFVAEGEKLVFDLLSTTKCHTLIGTKKAISKVLHLDIEEIIECDEDDLKKITFLKTPPQIIGVFHQPIFPFSKETIASSLNLVLDGIQDPGNLGAIIRIADWFGIENIFCSYDTVDVFSPKVVQASMGAIARINVLYVDIVDFLDSYKHTPIYGTFLDGECMYENELSPSGFVVMGNEGNGISDAIREKVTNKILIPSFPEGRTTSESLNVSMATAIVCAEFRRFSK